MTKYECPQCGDDLGGRSSALSELPEGTPGRTSVEDAHRIVKEAIDDGE